MTPIEGCVLPGRDRKLLLLLLALGLAISTSAGAQINTDLLFQIRDSGGYLGVNPVNIEADRAKELKLKELSGVEILAVQEGAAAYQAGIRPGDVLLSYNGEKVLGAQQFIRLVSETPPGRRVAIVCWRAGEQKQVWVTTGSRPVVTYDDEFVSTIRVTDVPSPMMLWRNIVLGIESESLSEQLAQALGVKQGILIWNVAGGSPAQHAGLRAGDVVTDFCGHTIRSPREVGFVLQQLQSVQKPVSTQAKSSAFSVNVMRDHKSISLSILLDGEER